MNVTKKEIEKAIKDGNDKDNESFAYYILCKMCERKPSHKEFGVVRDKILMIGRTYAAALERRPNKEKESIDNFYKIKVLPKIINSDIDRWFESLKNFKKIDSLIIPNILEVHFKIVKLFLDITGMNKRSLASKYLHFHFPHLFYIYDSRARKGLSMIIPRYRINRKKSNKYDNEYENFVFRLLDIQEKIEIKYKRILTPHQLDILLLNKTNQTV